MELFLLVLVALCGSVLAKPLEDGLWVFPDELENLTKKPNRFDFFQIKSVTSPKPDRKPKGRTTSETTTPLPDVLFHIPNCNCRFPPQYNPVCGSDGLSYVNAQMLKCARRCGNDVVIARIGACRGALVIKLRRVIRLFFNGYQ
nr:uncharacterized protein LOC106690749 [Halyomorpha halys]